MVWDWLYYVSFAALLLAGLALNILGLPGLWLMLAAAVAYGWITGWAYVGTPGLITLLVLALAAEAAEFVAGSAGAKQAGGSKRGMIGAIVGGLIGGVLGTPFMPVIGTVAGACLGSFAGAFAVEILLGKGMDRSTRIGMGAAKGRLYGTLIKLAFGFVMLIVGLWSGFPVRDVAPTPATAPGLPPATAPVPPLVEAENAGGAR